MEELAREHRVCPFELSLKVDFIICDYNYAFDPRVCLQRFFIDDRGDYVFLVDEAHNLVHGAREMFSAELHKQAFLDTRKALKTDLPEIYKSIWKVNAALVRTKQQVARMISFIVFHRKGNYLLFFPSYEYMHMVREVFLSENLDTATLLQGVISIPGSKTCRP